MRPAWLVLTILLAGAVVYLGRHTGSRLGPAGGEQDSPPPAQDPVPARGLATSMQKKLDHIRENGERPRPDPVPTVITEEEVNAYFAAGNVKLPAGVKKVVLQGNAGVVDAFVKVDFDEIRAGQRSSNPLLAIFSGVHDVRVQADAAGSGGEGKVHVRSASVDAVEVPRLALEFFVQKFVTPKYPSVGLDSTFPMPSKVDAATVGYHKLTIVQK